MKECVDILPQKKWCKKIPLHGVIKTNSKERLAIYDSQCFESFGTIHFKNKGSFEIKVYKNNLPDPVAVIKPNSSFTLTSEPFYRIEVQCKPPCKKQYKEIWHSKSHSTRSKRYNRVCRPCKPKYKCKLCYQGFVCVKVACDFCCDINDPLSEKNDSLAIDEQLLQL